ncbi:MATE family efflux transporter [Eubacterium oxidoreducens]|uniref:Multidrug export protein MepA n=1 Tax=Eubacterium oxidoreducens TaxID=1732 RepID=A0A1G6BXH4_EUBOX|nr:MATE family efflux transporter [Eubacterium oxidoreducens]SDB25326.1 Na+-driven multidrug efflux pump [Eubacterium oxidoreducens]
MSNVNTNQNPLAVEPVNKLIRYYALPSIISLLVGSLYNIVDQFFIGQKVGELGNAATNIAFPYSMFCLAVALLFGIGGASTFNLAMGEGKSRDAKKYMGNAISLSLIFGLVIFVIAEIFLQPSLRLFGASEAILPYATEYTRITAIGFPMVIFSTSAAHLIRADARPRASMICNLVGAIVNTILDAIFVFVLGWGMTGAAIATVLGQFVAVLMSIYYLAHGKTIQLDKASLIPERKTAAKIMSLGIAPSINQMAMMIVQIVMNNSLKYYGAMSAYGAETAIAVVGIASKVNQVFMSFIIGMAQGLQPIASFNYGARSYSRVKEAYYKTITIGAIMAIVAWGMFFFFPNQIISIFGKGSSQMYYEFAAKYFRIYLFFTMVNFLQPITANFMTALGKAKIGGFLSLARQIIFLLPLLVIFPIFWGINGLMLAGPIADFAAAVVSALFVVREFRRMEV